MKDTKGVRSTMVLSLVAAALVAGAGTGTALFASAQTLSQASRTSALATGATTATMAGTLRSPRH